MKKFTVDLKNPVQKNFLGLNAVYHGYASIPDKFGHTYSDEWAEIEADRAKELGLKIARTFCHWYAYEPETKSWNWENDDCKGFYKWLTRMQVRGIDVALNSGWWCPMDVNKIGYSPFAVENNWEKSVENYAAWVSELVHQLVEVRGYTNIKYLHIFTEPNGFAGIPTKSDQTPLTAWGDCIIAVDSRLKKDGRRHLVKLVGPNQGGGYNMMSEVAEKYGDYVDIFSAHQYQNSDLLKLRGIGQLAHSGKVATVFNLPGARIYQKVKLKANTEYTVSVHLRLICNDSRTTTGFFQYGLFNYIGNDKFGFSAGGKDITDRLQRYSVQSVEANVVDKEWQKFEFSFVCEKDSNAVFGVFYDVKDQDAIGVVDDVALAEKGGTNLLFSSDFSDTVGWGFVSAYPGTLDSADYLRIFGENAVKKTLCDKPFWHDEFNVAKICGNVDYDSGKHGTDLARCALAIMSSGAENMLMWSLFDQQWPNNRTTNNDGFVDGDHRWGVMPVFHRSFVPKPAYYAIGIIGNFFGGENCRSYYVPFNDFLEIGVNTLADGNISVIAINSKYEEDEFTLDFGEEIGKTFRRYVYNPEKIVPTKEAKMIEWDKEFTVNSSISDTLEPYSFAVYTTVKK